MEKIICPNCKTANDPKNLFCQSCGTSLSKPAAIVEPEKTVMSGRSKATAAEPPPPPVQTAVTPTPAMPVVTPPTPGMPPPTPQTIASAPPAPGYGQPPAAYGYPPVPMYMGTPIQKLGLHTDGWSDIVENKADLVEKVKQVFVEKINAEKIPGVRVTDATLSNNEMESRPYQLVHNSRGATIAVRIAPYGKNLFVGWDLYTHHTVNWLTIGLLGGIVFLLAFLDVLFADYYDYNFLMGVFGFIGTFLSWMLVPGLVLLLFGKIFKDDWLAFFVKDLNEFAADDAVALSTVVDNALSQAIEESDAPPAKTKK